MGATEWHYCGVTANQSFPSALRSFAPPRWRAALAVAALVLLSHALLLGLWHGAPGPGWQAQPPRPLQLRQIIAAAPLPAHAAPPAAATAMTAALLRPFPYSPPLPSSPPLPPPRQAALQSPSVPAPAPTRPPQAAEPVADSGGQTVPVYATQLPPPATLQFDLRRGPRLMRAELDWRPAAAHYRLTLQGAPFGWHSEGGFDPAGMAPLRYVESRRGRDLRATNFQRDNGLITFSGPAVEYPLVPGAQDRLSWMLQLAGVLAANPTLNEPEAQVSMWVVGTRGDAEVWTFSVLGRSTLELPIGRVDDVVHLQRQPRGPYDTQVQVWLDPARHFLPVQLWLRVRATGEGSEYQLRQLELR